jgi:ferric-dicitrate binding protein FerR (iron transport regulator)
MSAHRAAEVLRKIYSAEKETEQLISRQHPVRKLWVKASAVAAILMIVATSWWLWYGHSTHTTINRPETSVQTPLVQEEKKFIHLPDGSTVLLNKNSHLDYPDVFGNRREVSLTGEAYFDIQHDATKPFIVHIGKVNVTVLGTAFNVRADEAGKVVVTVTRGRVRVADSTRILGVLVPNEQITVNTVTASFAQTQVNAATVIAWKKQYLVLDNISLEEAAVLIGDKYHVNIILSNEKMKSCRISATFLNNESLEQVLTVVSGVVNATYTLQPNDQVILKGEGCN